MDRLLARQLRKLGLEHDALPEDLSAWQSFVEQVGRSYEQNKQDRYLLERSMEVSSQEMQTLYKDLQMASETMVAQERDRLEATISGLLDGFCALDLDGKISNANPVAQELLAGLAEGQKPLTSFVIHDPSGDRVVAEDELLRWIASGLSIRDEDALLNREGQQPLAVSVSVFPILLQDEIAGVGFLFRDVSELKRSELLRLRLQKAVEASADAIYITDPNGIIEYINPAFTAITGLQSEDALGKDPSVLSSGRTPKAVIQGLWNTIKAGKVWSSRIQNRRKLSAGSKRSPFYWSQSTIAPIRDEEGKEAGFVAVQRDISRDVRRERRRSLEHGAAELRALVAQTMQQPDTIEYRLELMLDLLLKHPTLGMTGEAAVYLFPQVSFDAPETLEGEETAIQILVQNDDPSWLGTAPPEWKPADDQDVLETGYDQERGLYRVPIRHSGSIVGELVIAGSAPREDDIRYQLFSGLGQMLGVTFADEHARHEAERARKAAEDAAQAKSKFLANMSHEIRTPMNGVLGMLEMMAESELTHEQRDYLTTAHGSAESLLTIINDILDFSKIEAGKLDLELIPFDARFTAEDVATLFSAPAQSKNLEIACYVDAQAQTRVVGDPTRLRQVLNNLIGNAVKFTQHGEVLLRVQQTSSDSDNAVLRFEVKDTGIGISEEAQKGLFQPFMQADSSMTRKYGGTGLGLAISRQLIELMGGELHLDSVEGEGSTFWFELPYQAQTGEQMSRDTSDLLGRRVLVVDDNPTNLTIAGNYLSNWGVDYALSESGADALKRMQQGLDETRPFDVVLLDMQMPGMDGITLAQAIKRDNRLRDTGLVMISSAGFSMEELHTAGIDLGIAKPLRQSVLHNALLEVSGKGGSYVPPKTESHDVGTLKGLVLLAEDNHVNQKVAKNMLGRIGLTVDIAENGREALKMVGQKPYSLVLMDCQMPLMDGFQATQAIRGLETLSGGRSPIVAMTANAMAGDRERCIAAGMDDYIPKPVKILQLYQTLAKWLPPGDGPVDDNKEGLPPKQEPAKNTELEEKAAPMSDQTKESSEATETNANPPLDPETLEVLQMTMEDEFGILVETYLEDTEALMEALFKSIESSDSDEIARQAHMLKSSSASFGAMGLADMAKTLEEAGRLKELDVPPALVRPLGEEWRRVKTALHALDID